MAGTVTKVEANIRANGEKFGGKKYTISWTSDASGDATIAISQMNGWLVKVVTDPGSTAPTDDYDLTLVDENSLDALASTGLNRDTTNTEQVYNVMSGAVVPIFLSGDHTFTIANAGNAKVGVAVLYVVNHL